MKILTAQQIKEVDELTSRQTEMPSLLLMENAAQAVIHYLESERSPLFGLRILVVCGKGNNGGDGLAAARLLLLRGALPEICLLAKPDELHGDALQNYRMASLSHIPIHLMAGKPVSDWPQNWTGWDILLDGILGTGLRGTVTGIVVEAIEWINRHFLGFVLAIDLPSGLESDSGEIPGPAVCADATVTFTAPKLCHVLTPACVCCGKTWVAPIGTPSYLLDRQDFNIELITSCGLSPVVDQRKISAHKGSFGKILILAGSRGKSGAAAMAGLAALRSGAGLVKIAVPKGIQSVVSGFSAECMTEGLPETEDGFFAAEASMAALELARQHDVLAIGPGMGQEAAVAQFLEKILRECPCPIIADADAINCMAHYPMDISTAGNRLLVLTPHPGEMTRLTGLDTFEIQRNRIGVARRLSMERNIYIVLKGARTVVAAPDGRIHINPTGNPGMATAGSGDVLTGMVASILAQQLLLVSPQNLTPSDILQALGTAVYWHGLAGDAAAFQSGQQAMVATDLIRQLPETHSQLKRTESVHVGGLKSLFPEPVNKTKVS